MSTFTTFNINDIVFVQNIGYGVLMDCGATKTISLKQLPSVSQKKQSIYFDPDLFSSQTDSMSKKSSQPAVLVNVNDSKLQTKKSEGKIQSTLPVTMQIPKNKSQPLNQQKQKKQQSINIVKVRLEGTQVLVYTSDKNIRKYVIVPVKPLFAPAIGTLNIKIQIGKTIQSFKRQIFDLLGLKHAHYFNVKLFTTSPNLSELNFPGKTIWQCGIRESSTLTLTAEHGFIFENIPQNLTQYFNVVNNNLTLVALPRKPKVAQNIIIALPPPQTTPVVNNNVQTPTKVNQNQAVVANNVQSPIKIQQKQKRQQQVNKVVQQANKQVKAAQENNINKQVQQQQVQKSPQKPSNNQNKANDEQKVNQKIIQQKAGQTKQNKNETQLIIPETVQVKGDFFIKHGKRYFEVRLDKLSTNPENLKIGVISQNEDKKWYFSPLTQKKSYYENNIQKTTQNYGISFKQNDIIGVFVKIDKQKNMRLSFYKNNIGLGICFQARIEQIGFIFTIGNQGQISLQTRIQPPLDSYRFR